MPTIIDSLVVQLGLDSSGFNANKTKVDKGLKETGEAAKKTGKEFDETAKMVGKFLAALGGAVAIKRFVEDTISASAALDRLSKNLGDSATNISAWSNAAEVAGGTAEGLQGTMDMLSRSQTELMLTGQSGLIPYFSALGVAIADTSGKARPASDMLLDLAGRFEGMDRTTANNMGRAMGIDQGTMSLLIKGRSEVELMLKRQKEYNAITDKQTEAAARLSKRMIEGRQNLEAFGRTFVTAAMPALEKFFDILQTVGDWMRKNEQFVTAFFTVIATAITAYLVPALWALVAPILPVTLGILAVAAAIALLYDDFQTFKQGGQSLLPWAEWEDELELATKGIKKFKDFASDAFYRIFAAADAARAAVSGDWSHAKWAWGEAVNGNQTSAASGAPTAGGKGAPSSPQAFFESKGWSPAQAAGIVANLKAESAMNPAAVGDNGKAYGIAQWHPDRQANFAKFAGKDIRGSSVEEQMAFVHYELSQGAERGAGRSLRNAQTPQAAGEIVSRLYERPANADAEARKRGLLAVAGAAQYAQGAGAGNAAARLSSTTAAASNNTSTTETTIGQIVVNTQATDAAGMVKDMNKSMDYLFASQANTGLN